MKPLTLAHKGGDCFGVENSLTAIKKALKFKPDIIEVDVRKSKDNILFCYHGNILEFLLPKLFFKKKLKTLKHRYPTIATLKQVASLIGNKSILFLDIQDKDINVEDVIKELKGVKIKEVYLAKNDLEFHKNIKKLPLKWKKVYNVGIPVLKPKIKEIINAKIDVIELFFWDFKEENIKLLRKQGIEVALSHRFIPPQIYFKKCFSKKALWVWQQELLQLIKYKEEVTT